MSDAPSPTLSSVPPPAGLVALAFTDLEGSSALSERLGSAFETWRELHFRLLREPLAQNGGYEVETAGDSLFAVFSGVEGATQWAVAAQRAMKNHSWPPEIGELRVRIGIHVGEPFIGHDETTGRLTYRGPATNRAARVMGAANGGQSLLSHAARVLLNRVPYGLELRDLGFHRLKGIGDEQIFQLGATDLPQEFGPLQTLSTRRHNLPLPPTLLVGHEQKLAQWRDLILEPKTRLLTLCGFGGLGKTRLALQLAESVVEEFPDGVWWIALEQARDESEMVAAIAAGLPFEVSLQAPLLEQITTYLSGRRVLLVLDNTEQISAAAQVVGALTGQATSGFKMIVTTRHALHLRIETTREVPPLTTDEGARLFCDHALGYDVPLNPDDTSVRAIARRVEGVPLALELAAAFAAILEPEQILEGLDDQLSLLTSQIPDLPPRQRALRATMDWSYEMLAEQERDFFAQLAVFSGGFSLRDAQAVTNSPQVLFAIQELHRRSLLRGATSRDPSATRVRQPEMRYFMLESVRTYALERLDALPDAGQGVRASHALYFASVTENWAAHLHTRDEAVVLGSAEADFDNARAALNWAMAQRATESLLAARLALTLGQLLHRSGRLREAGERFADGLNVLTSPVKEKHPPIYAALMLGRSDAYYDLFAWEKAESCAREALSCFETASDWRGIAQAHNLLGLIALRGAKDHTVAQTFFEAALRDFVNCGHAIGQASVQVNLGLIAHQNGDLVAARKYWEAALTIYRVEDYERGAAGALTNLGVLAQEQGQLDEAWSHYENALQLELKARGQFGVARALSNLGELALERGEWSRACRILAVGTRLFERAGSPHQSYTSNLLKQASVAAQQDAISMMSQFSNQSVEELASLAMTSP